MINLKQALKLWKSEIHRKGTTLQRRLMLFFACISAFFILLFTLLLMLFGINGKEEKTVHTFFDNELSDISKLIYNGFGNLSVEGISMAEIISDSCDAYFESNGITAKELSANPDLIEPLLSLQIQTLLNTVNRNSCGGTYIMLDATVQPDTKNASNMKSGIFLKKTQPTSTQSVGVKNYFLRGPAEIARENGIELIGQWEMEYDISNEHFFQDVFKTARSNGDLPISRLYYWTERVTLKDNSESGFLLCVPLRSKDGTVFGICGIEVSDRLFKQLYSPSNLTYENVFAIAAPSSGNTLYASQGIIAGNYYLTTNLITEDLSLTDVKNNFDYFTGNNGSYCGNSVPLRLYPSGSPYLNKRWSVAILMPKAMMNSAVTGSSRLLFAIVFILLALSLVASVLISNRYLQPVTKALNSIRDNNYDNDMGTSYLEIADLFDFLADKDKEHDKKIQQLEQLRKNALAEAESAQSQLSNLSEKKRKEVDSDAYALFLSSLDKLTAKEKSIFDLYLSGKTAREIMVIANINENTLKYHNRNIYSKLCVSSRKELILFATLMKQSKS